MYSSYHHSALPADPSTVYPLPPPPYSTAHYYSVHPPDDSAAAAEDDDGLDSVQYRHRDSRDRLLSSSSSSSSSRVALRPPSVTADGGYLTPAQQRGSFQSTVPQGPFPSTGRRRVPPPPPVAPSAFSSAFASGGVARPPSLFASRSRSPSPSPPPDLFTSHDRTEAYEDEEEEKGLEEHKTPSNRQSPSSPPPSRRPHPPPPPPSFPPPRQPSPYPEAVDDWMEMDDDTRHLLQRSANPRSHQAMDEEAFLWGEASALPIKAELATSRSVRSRVESLTGSGGLSEQQRKERLYLHKVASQEGRKKKGPLIGPRETDLGRLSLMKRKAALPPTPSQSAKPPPRGNLSFTAAFERELQRERPPVLGVDIEEVDSFPADAAASTGTVNGGGGRKSWKDEVDAAVERAPPTSLSATRPGHALHGKRSRRRGGLEDRLDVLIRSRHSSVAIAQHRQQQLLLSQSTPIIAPDAEGRYPSVLVKMVSGVEFYSLYFTVCILCSPYNPPPMSLYIPEPTALAIPSVLPSLLSFADSYGVPLSRVALVIFSAQQRRDMRQLPTDFSSPAYLQLLFPWYDVGERMRVYGRVLVDVFDCVAIDKQRGEEEEKKDEVRRALELLTEMNAEGSQSEVPGDVSQLSVEMKDGEEEEKQKEALRAVFGDLEADEISSLFEGAEEEERHQLLQRMEEQGNVPPPTSPLPPPATKPFSEYRRLTLASLQSFTSLHQTCVVGVIRKVQLNGHGDVIPSSPPFTRSRLPCFWIDDGTALVQVDISLAVVKEWREVLLRGTGKVVWIGGGHMNEHPALGCGEMDGLTSMLESLRRGEQRGMRVIQVGDRSRWRMQALHEQSLIPAEHLRCEQSLTHLRELITGERREGRVVVHVRVMHIQWTAPDEALVWLSDPSLMPSTPSMAASHHPPPSNCLVVAFHRFLHLQLLRSFIHPSDLHASALLIQDLLLTPSSSSTGTWPTVEADAFTELLLPFDDLRCEVVGFEQTQQFDQARAALGFVNAVDPRCPSVPLALPQHLVAPFTVVPVIPPLSSLLTSQALMGQTASLALQRFGLFVLDGVVLQVHGPALLVRQCPACGYEMAHVKGERRSLLSAFCPLCKGMSGEAHPVVGRVVVSVKCSDIVQALQVELSPALLNGSVGDVSKGSRLAVLTDEEELRGALLSKRIRCICVCVEPKDSAMAVRDLVFRSMDEGREVRRRD